MYPLVSIIVLAYNSSKYIQETLNSINEQSYDNLELIITDDGSEDNTIGVVNAWLNGVKKKFIDVKILTVNENTGIAANINRGIISAKGDWIKLIAADDILLPNCIIDNISFATEKSYEIQIVQSSSKYFNEKFDKSSFLYDRLIQYEPLAQSNNPHFQFKILQWAPSVNSPSIFIKRSVFFQIGLFDVSIAEFDDWPMWLKISKSNIPIYSLSKLTVCYRINNDSISNKGRNNKIFSSFYHKLYRFSKEHIYKEMSLLDRLFKEYEYFVLKIIDKTGLNKNKPLFKAFFLIMLLPYNLYTKVRLKYYKIKIR